MTPAVRWHQTLALLGALLFLWAPSPVAAQSWDDEEGSLPVEVHGFLEAAGAARAIDQKIHPNDFLLGEARFRLQLDHYTDRTEASFKGDVIADAVTEDVTIDFREAIVTLHATDWWDVRAGRQVLTWGTGDFVFLNDLFPKDFESFFSGRADEFLKAPSNSVKTSFYSDLANLDLVWTPIFEPDRPLKGDRYVFFNPLATPPQLVGGPLVPFVAVRPSKTLANGEFAARLYGNAGAYELAAYGYSGFSKQPRALIPTLPTPTPTYSRLAVYGASARGPLWGGIFWAEGAFHHSYDDDGGTNPFTPNSQIRGLAGYEHEVLPKFTAGVQYYIEHIFEYNDLLANSPLPAFEPDRNLHWITLRLTYMAMQDNLTLSLFTFVSPSSKDAHLRPSVTYQFTDQVALTAGGNAMFGSDDYTFFGQLEDNTNVYTRVRYTF